MATWRYNKADTKRFTARTFHADGIFARMIIDAERYEDENSDDVKIVTTSVALSDPSDDTSTVKGSELKKWVTLPLSNIDVDGHVPPDRSGKDWAEFASAIFPKEVPHKPRKEEVGADGKMTGPYFVEDGSEEIDDDDYGKHIDESVEAAGIKAIDIVQDPSMLVGCAYFCKIKRTKSTKNGKTYTNENAVRATLPENWELSTEYVAQEGAAAAADNGNGAGATQATKKATKKKVTKKKSRRR